VPPADYMNNTPKVVVSNTLNSVDEWQNSTLLKGNFVDEITNLKQQPGGSIGVTGSGTLVRSLLENNLLDELRLLVHPIIVGSGKHLFPDGTPQKGLTLTESKIFDNGVLYLTYAPADS
jgi:dihydrofolate reductase